MRLAEAVRYDNLGTFEFLVDAGDERREAPFAFIEANPRLQVEHTVTEEVTGVDLVKLQLKLAGGYSLAELGLRQADVPAPRGFAIQLRINMESMGADGIAKPAGGTIAAFEMPSGPGLRTDTFGYAGYTTSPRFDSLLAKLIAHSPSTDFAEVVSKAYRALCEFRIEGVATNIGFLQSLLRHPDFVANGVYTRFVEDHIAELVATRARHRRTFIELFARRSHGAAASGGKPAPAGATAGCRKSTRDPLAVLHHGKGRQAGAVEHPPVRLAAARTYDIDGPDGTIAVAAPMQGTIVSIDVREGDIGASGQQLFVMEAMKMEHVIRPPPAASCGGSLWRKATRSSRGTRSPSSRSATSSSTRRRRAVAVDLDRIRADLAEVRERHAIGLDAARPDAVARRRKTGQRTARENIDDLCDPGSVRRVRRRW